MKNKRIKELNNLKKLTNSRLFHKNFKLPNLTISSTYQNYSKDVFHFMDDIYEQKSSWSNRKDYNGIRFVEVA